MVAPAAERDAVAHIPDCLWDERAAGVPSVGMLPDDDRLPRRFGPMTPCCAMGLKAIAHERRRFGYRRLHVLLRREGYQVNHKRLFRIYHEEKLMVRRRGGRKRAMGTRAPMLIPMAPNERWSLDFVSDQMTDGRRFPGADGGRSLRT